MRIKNVYGITLQFQQSIGKKRKMKWKYKIIAFILHSYPNILPVIWAFFIQQLLNGNLS